MPHTTHCTIVEVLEHRGDMQKEAPTRTESQDPPHPEPTNVPLIARMSEYLQSGQ